MQLRLSSALLLLCQLAFAWLIAAKAQAAQFDVAPISMSLSAKTSSATLVITNRAAEPLRFQVTAFAWNQKPNGEMILEPTKDIVFFPAMLVLNPKDSRQIRVGTKLKPGPIERTYRLFVEELPPLSKKDEPNAVRVLTKMGVPVFLEAQAPRAVPSVTAPVLLGRQVTFSVKNSGTAHMRVQKVRLTAKNATK